MSAGLEIRARRPRWQVRLIIGLGAVVLGVAAYQWGYSRGGEDNSIHLQTISEQQATIQGQGELIEGLKIQLAQLEQGRRVDQVAVNEVKEALKEQQQEVLELSEEIAFYRGIVSPSEAKTGIQIQRFELQPLDEARLFHYRLVLTQVLKNERVTRGTVEVYISGVEAGKPKRLALNEVVEELKGSMNFRFRYFQMFEGDLLLPDGFSARSIDVTVKPGKSRSSISESFPWPEATLLPDE